MRYIARFSLPSLGVLFTDVVMLAATSAKGPIRAADLHSGSFAKLASAASIPNFRNTPGDQAATETTTERNKALTLKPSDELGNKNMATAPGLIDGNRVMYRTCSSFTKRLAALKQKKASMHAKWNIHRWAAGDDIFSGDDQVISRSSVRRTSKKAPVSQRQRRPEQLKRKRPETVSLAKHLFYKGGRNHAQNAK